MYIPYAVQDVVRRAKINPPDLSQENLTKISIFIAFQLIGLIGSILVILTVLISKKTTRRQLSWYNFMGAWVISSLSYCLLFFAGELRNPKPSFGVCNLQAALVYATPPHAAATAFGLVLQIWFNVWGMSDTKDSHRTLEKIMVRCSFVLPYIIWIGIVIESLVLGFQEPSSIRRTGSGMYCNSGNPILGRISTGLIVVVLIPAIILEFTMAIFIRRHWGIFRSKRQALEMVLRVFIFTLFGVFALSLSLVFFFTIHHGSDLNIVIAAVPVGAVICFGSQRDIIESWMFWKWFKKSEEKALPVLPETPQSSKSTPNSATPLTVDKYKQGNYF